ncbi:MAG TPA: signal peptidase I [Candidatus Lumbricidophila sp.]|nr:signal peptidase I [Candidatus Lumbricidophila sp.]
MAAARSRRRVVTVLGDVGLTIAACAGSVCIALVIAGLLFNVSIILFSTGSMSPTIPAGSAALVRDVPAAELKIGDVVTVDRPGKLPVTHRIVAIAPSADGKTELTLRGDANPTNDPLPYNVTHVRIVLWSVPGIANGIVGLGNPLVMGGLTLAATVLVVWMFWPRTPRRPAPSGGGRHRASATTTSIGLVFAAAAALILTNAPTTAHAAIEETSVAGSVVELTSIGDPALMERMAPGDAVTWQVGVRANTSDPGTITLTWSGTGVAGLGLEGDIRSCPERWVNGTCPAPTMLISAQPLPVDGTSRPLLTMRANEPRWLLFDVRMPATTVNPQGLVQLRVRATGVGDPVEVGPPGPGVGLARTGANPGSALVATAILLLGGLVLLIARGRARRATRDEAFPEPVGGPALRAGADSCK